MTKYANMTVAQLRKEAKAASITLPAKAKKDDIIALLAPKASTGKRAARDAQLLTIVNTDYEFGGPGTVRRKSWDILAKAKGGITIGEFRKAGGATKYIPRWAKAGAVQVAA